ncbi:MAG: HopJ type III effector protein [Gammaproteobacteria bacterium]|nr:HopJ type III effector protein [Gammaproteobacteria bacterium]
MTKTEQLLQQLASSAESVSFNQVIEAIESDYNYTPSRFTNGLGSNMAINEAGTNEGSCKIFAFAEINQLTEQQTLHCFGDYYRHDVLQNSLGSDHANIRNFMQHGWTGVKFDETALIKK